MDKANIKTTDWLTKGLTEDQIQSKKCKAIKQAERELARIEKKKGKKEMRAYRKMYRRHRKELVKHAKATREWDWGWLHDSVIMQIRHMYEYYTARNNVHQSDESLIPLINSLKYVLDLNDKIDHLWDDNTDGHGVNEDGDTTTTMSDESFIEKSNEEMALYKEIYVHISDNLRTWWD